MPVMRPATFVRRFPQTELPPSFAARARWDCCIPIEAEIAKMREKYAGEEEAEGMFGAVAQEIDWIEDGNFTTETC